MVRAACWPALTSYLAAALLLAGLTAAAGVDGSLEWLARAGAMGWLVAHHVPVIIDGAPLGVLPLLPTVGVGALIARSAARVAMRSGIHQSVDAGWVAGVFAATHGVLGVVLTLVATPATVTADPGLAALACALVAAVSVGIGLARPCGLLPVALRQAPAWVRPGLDAGLWGLVALLAAGLTTVLLALSISATEAFQITGSDAGRVLGLTVLSIGYLPNAAIAGLSWLAGPGFSIGMLRVSPFAVHSGPVPALPLLAAVPQGPVQPWWGAALAILLLIGAGVGRRCVTAARERSERLRILTVAATVLGLGSAVLGGLAGGRLGTAAFDPVDVPFGMLMGAVLATTLLGSTTVVMLSFRVRGPEPRTDDTNEETDKESDPDKAGHDNAVEMGENTHIAQGDGAAGVDPG
jgi:Family of unknown function (DUF6350)